MLPYYYSTQEIALDPGYPVMYTRPFRFKIAATKAGTFGVNRAHFLGGRRLDDDLDSEHALSPGGAASGAGRRRRFVASADAAADRAQHLLSALWPGPDRLKYTASRTSRCPPGQSPSRGKRAVDTHAHGAVLLRVHALAAQPVRPCAAACRANRRRLRYLRSVRISEFDDNWLAA